jgi:omega-amidase
MPKVPKAMTIPLHNKTVRICCAQAGSRWDSPEENLRRAARCAAEAAEHGASLIVFPEQYATGWDPSAASRAEPPGGPVQSAFAAIAGEAGITVVGSARIIDGERLTNSCVVYGPKGDLLVSYAKMHLFSPSGEQMVYSPGNALGCFEVEGVRFGLAVCYDLRFADLFRAYARAGVHCVCVPAAWPCERLHHWRLFVQARALENQYYVAGTGTIGTTPVGEYCGGSVVVGPDGDERAAGGDGEHLLFADIDPSEVMRVRASFPVTADRRDDLYRTL